MHKNTQRKWLEVSTLMLETERRTSAEFFTNHRNDLEYSASARTERKIEQSGLEVSRFYCILTRRNLRDGFVEMDL
jgi:hypothetical protein